METLSYQERLNRVLRHIENNLDDHSDLDALAEVACFSPYHFHRIFTAMMGESVAAYVRRLLLQRASSQLSFTKESVTQIALGAGYDSLDAFTRAFRAYFGVSPSEYRRTGGSLVRAQKQDSTQQLFYHLAPDALPMEVRVKKFSPVPVAALRYTGPYDDCAPAWTHLIGALASRDLLAENAVGYGVGHDNPDVTPKEKCRMEVCVSLPDGATAEAPAVKELLHDKELYLRKIGGSFDYAAMLVAGPYSLLHPAYRSLYGEWLPQSGREPADDPGFEIYYNCPETTAPEDLMTEIFVPLKPM